ncbi:hypothetical protein HK101_006549, partial [Irineochytrium annulatum]
MSSSQPLKGVRDPIKDGSDRICYLMFLLELTDAMNALPPALAVSVPSWDTDPAPPMETPIRPPLHAPMAAAGLSTTGLQSIEVSPLRRTRDAQNALMGGEGVDVEAVMSRIRTKARTERIRVIDFMRDFDALRCGRITRNHFRRALKVLYLELTEDQLAALETTYENPHDRASIDYVRFSDDVESVFTAKGLETAPTVNPATFAGYSKGADPALNKLEGEGDEKILRKVIARLREKVIIRRVDILSYLEDFDFVREGTITTNQFRSVLCTHNLGVDDEEIKVLARRFTIDAKMDRINYRAFATAVTSSADEVAGIGMVGHPSIPVHTFGI